MQEFLLNPDHWMAFAALVSLEIVLGIDNIIFISIMVSRLPEKQRDLARRLGIGLALVSRLALLFSLYWIMGLVEPLFTVFNQEISGRDLILIVGGLFLLAKSTHEIHTSLEMEAEHSAKVGAAVSMLSVIVQICIIDIVFSLDSVITAVGLVEEIEIMVAAIVIAVVVMLVSAKPIGNFIDQNPALKILALSFLILIGVTLIGEGLDMHVPKGYIYFSMAFALIVELINMRLRKKQKKPNIKEELS